MTIKKLVLLVPDDAIAERVNARLVRRSDLEVHVITTRGAVVSAIAAAREAHPMVPIAMIACTDADALEALEADADEALTLPQFDDRSLDLLLERAIARATLRLAHASAHGDAAHADKLAALGTVVAGIAHEINNPLSIVLMQLEVLKHIVKPLVSVNEEIRRSAMRGRALLPHDVERLERLGRTDTPAAEIVSILSEMEDSIARATEIVRDLRIYARADDEGTSELVDVAGLIEQLTRIIEPQIRGMGHLERDYAPDLPLLALPRTRIVQVLTNILVNAVQAMEEMERPIHRVRITARADGEFVAISISDTGPGIPAERIGQIFDPFFTTKDTGKGTGLGLSISQSILRKLGGDLIAESVHGEGATFIALLPVPDEVALHKAEMAAKKATNGAVHGSPRPTVLVVEDDERLLRAYPRALHEYYDVIVASDGQEAIDLLVSGSVADIVLTDLAMPEVDGEQLFHWLVEHRPELARKTIFVTAGARNGRASEFIDSMQTNTVLEKPVSREQLLDALDRVLR